MTEAPQLFDETQPAKPAADRINRDSENWSVRADDEALAVSTQPAIWVYRNAQNAVVIRMESFDPHEPDGFVLIRPENIEAVVTLMRRVKAEIAA